MIIESRYTLPQDVVRDISRKNYKFGFDGFGEIVYHTNYSRLLSDGRQENWIDTCKRVVEGVLSIRKDWYETHSLKWDTQYWDTIASDMLYYIFKLKLLPPGRGLWAGGTDYVYERGSMALNNCGASLVETDTYAEDIGWIMNALMCGTGVGLKIEVDKETLRSKLKKGSVGKPMIIADSRKGWVDSVISLLNSYRKTVDRRIMFDYDSIRPLGSPIKGFGGVASGPAPLIELHKRIRKYMSDFIKGIYGAIRTFADVANAVGACIVAGNIRRCLPIGTLVYTINGLKKIENVYAGTKVLTAKGYCEVTANIYQGKQKLLKIWTETGSFRCTPNHKVAVYETEYSYGWKRADELTMSDRLVLVYGALEDCGITHNTDTEYNIAPLKIFKISKEIKTEYTYDLTVEDRNEFVIENRILVHNSAELILGSPTDEEFINLKNYSQHPERQDIGWLSNNTVVLENKSDFLKLDKISELICNNGEPGILNLKNVQKYERFGQIGRLDKATLVNPCLHEDTLIMVKKEEGHFFKKIKDIKVGDEIQGPKDWTKVLKVWDNGIQSVYRYNTVFGGILLTRCHKVVNKGEKIPVKEAKYLEYEVGGSMILAPIRSEKYAGFLHVYDLTVDNEFHTFIADGVHVSNCSEICLENKGLCNLAEIFPLKAKSKKDFLRMCELATIYTTSISLLPTEDTDTNAVIARNRRIGVSLSGIADWFDTWGAFKIINFMRDGYKHIRECAEHFNQEAGVPTPIRVTTVKPSGTVSQLAGVSPGMHFPIFQYAIRRMRISNTSPILAVCEKAGIPIEDDVYSKGNTKVIEYPIYTGGTRPASEVSAWEQFNLLALLQREWSDNMVSCTIHFTEEEKSDLSRILAYNIPLIKSVSLLPKKDNVYEQMPYDGITREDYNKRRESIKKIDWDNFNGLDGKDSKFCSNDSCEI